MPSTRDLSSILSVSLVLGVAATFSTISAQQQDNNLKPLPNHGPTSFAGAENRWRLTVIDPQQQADHVGVDERAARNAYWRPYLERFNAIQVPGRSLVVPTGVAPTPTEIVTYPDAVWVVATFDSFVVIPVDSDYKLIYSEMRFTVTRVIDEKPPQSLVTGSTFDVYIPGGRLRKKDGTIASSLVQPSSSPQLKHKYMMQIRPVGVHNWIIAKRWDITSGTVSERNSVLSGMDEDTAVQHLASLAHK